MGLEKERTPPDTGEPSSQEKGTILGREDVWLKVRLRTPPAPRQGISFVGKEDGRPWARGGKRRIIGTTCPDAGEAEGTRNPQPHAPPNPHKNRVKIKPAKGTWRCLLWMTVGWRSALGSSVMHPPSKHASTFLPSTSGGVHCRMPKTGVRGSKLGGAPSRKDTQGRSHVQRVGERGPKTAPGVDHPAQRRKGHNPPPPTTHHPPPRPSPRQGTKAGGRNGRILGHRQPDVSPSGCCCGGFHPAWPSDRRHSTGVCPPSGVCCCGVRGPSFPLPPPSHHPPRTASRGTKGGKGKQKQLPDRRNHAASCATMQSAARHGRKNGLQKPTYLHKGVVKKLPSFWHKTPQDFPTS